MGIFLKVMRNDKPLRAKIDFEGEMEVQMDDGIYASNEHITLAQSAAF